MADTQAIRQKMRGKALTAQQVATRLAMHQSTFYRKLEKEGATFTLKQAQILANLLNLTSDELQNIFFT